MAASDYLHKLSEQMGSPRTEETKIANRGGAQPDKYTKRCSWLSGWPTLAVAQRALLQLAGLLLLAMTGPGRLPSWAWLSLHGHLVAFWLACAPWLPNCHRHCPSIDHTKLTEMLSFCDTLCKKLPRGGPTTEETKLKTRLNREDNQLENG